MIHPCVKGKNIDVAHASLQRSRSLTRAPSATGKKMAASKRKKTVVAQQRTRGIRDSISRGRESGRSNAFGEGR